MTTTELLLDRPSFDSHGERPGYHVRLAANQSDVAAAQRLRSLVFGPDGGQDTPGPVSHDTDAFDDRSDHLLVWYHDGVGPAQAVATYRLLPPHSNDAAPRGTGLDAHRHFGLMPLEALLDSTVEISRACVRADHRGGSAISLLWGAVARYLHLTGYRYLLGSIGMDLQDGGRTAAAFWDLAVAAHLAPAERRCRPRDPIAIGSVPRVDGVLLPPVISGYLRLGAQVCGPPGRDHTFGTATFLLLLDLRDVDQRYRRRYLGSDG